MAITKELERSRVPCRGLFPTAYIKILSPEIRGNEVSIMVMFFADSDARNTPDALTIGRTVEKTDLATFAPLVSEWTESGLKAAGYAYLKTKPEYQGVDC
jgi:hypothetical protein